MTELIPTRKAYGKALSELGKTYTNIVALDADLACSTKSLAFGELFPERFFNMGISEQDMMGTAAGLAVCGKIPFASTFAIFSTARALDQIRNSICYPKLNVRIVGSHSGLLTGEDGASHQAIEDIAIIRALPNMTIIFPADAIETESAMDYLVKSHKSPAYLRLMRKGTPMINSPDYRFNLGKGKVLSEGTELTIIAAGSLVGIALEAIKELPNNSVRIVNMASIKPIDEELIIRCAKETKGIITCEDHNIIGGLGSAVAEVLSENYPARLKRIGVNDVFGESGKPKELYEKYGLTKENIIKNVKQMLEESK